MKITEIMKVCPYCEGEGGYNINMDLGDHEKADFVTMWQTCPHCKGEGKTLKGICLKHGFIYKNHSIILEVKNKSINLLNFIGLVGIEEIIIIDDDFVKIEDKEGNLYDFEGEFILIEE